jgi:DNA-binding LacI/PurR family transcriptional regulator
VASDHETGSYELTKWLISQGRKRILRLWTTHWTGPEEKREWLHQRDLGYERAMQEAGLEPLKPLEIFGQVHRGPDTSETFRQEARLLAGYLIEYLTMDQPIDAVMAVSDSSVPAIAAALKLHGREPNKDILIVGYDNMWQDMSANRWEPTQPAATVDKRNLELGSELMRLLQERIEGSLPPQGQHRVVKPDLIILQK